MNYAVIWTQKSIADAQAIRRYYEARDPDAVEAVVRPIHAVATRDRFRRA